jgi:hypothetical protein
VKASSRRLPTGDKASLEPPWVLKMSAATIEVASSSSADFSDLAACTIVYMLKSVLVTRVGAGLVTELVPVAHCKSAQELHKLPSSIGRIMRKHDAVMRAFNS